MRAAAAVGVLSACVRARARACVRVRVRPCAHAHGRKCMRPCVHSCCAVVMRVSVSVCLCVCGIAPTNLQTQPERAMTEPAATRRHFLLTGSAHRPPDSAQPGAAARRARPGAG